MSEEAAELEPAEAFSLVGHELRFRALLELSRADGDLSFSELRERVGVDDPGQFNYHLGKLVGRFVRDTGDGYASTTAGDRVVGAVLSGGLTDTADLDPIDLGADCPRCGMSLAMRFPESWVTVKCRDCDYTVLATTLPAGVLDGVDREDVPRLVDQWFHRVSRALEAEFCLYCDNPLDVGMRHHDDPEAPPWVDGDEYVAGAVYECDRCESDWTTSVPAALLRHIAVLAFHHDHGTDLQSIPLWEREAAERSDARVAGRDPLRVEVTFYAGDEELAVTVDEHLDVVATARSLSFRSA